jgi:hypothetical protein
MRFFLPFTLSLGLAVATPVAAQVDWLPVPDEGPRRDDVRPAVGEWHFGADIGFANFVPAVFQERGTRFVLYGERQVHRWFAVQLDGNCSRGARRRVFGEPQEFVSVCAGVVSAVVPIPLTRSLWPYVRTGYGVALWDEQAREGFYDVEAIAPSAVLAAGVRAYFGAQQQVGLRLDVQRQQTALRQLQVPHWSFGLGVSMRFPRGYTLED